VRRVESLVETVKAALHRLRGLRDPERIHAEIAEEMRFHIEQGAVDEIRFGRSPDEARRAAERRFGRLVEMKERAYDARGAGWIESFVQDVRYGARALRRSPVFTLTAVVTLALGVGANSAVFNVVQRVLLRPLAFRDAERLYVVRERMPQQSAIAVSAPEFDDFHAQSVSFEAISATIPRFTYTWTGDGEPRTVRCTAITDDFFRALRMRPLIGRLYTPAEYHIDGVQVVLSYRFWKTQLGGDPNVLGRVLQFSGEGQTVIGVMPEVPDLFPDVDVWAKLVPDFEFMRWRDNRFLTVIGRLNPGVTPAQATDELTAILRRGPGESAQRSVALVSLKDEVVGDVRTPLTIVMGAVLLVLLASSVNVTSMLLARMSGRQSEIAIRMSMGARPIRLFGQFVTENLLLVTLGSALGLVLAAGVVSAAARGGVGNLPRGGDIGIGGSGLAFTMTATVILSLVLSWAPASLLGRIDLNSALKSGKVAARRWSGLRILVTSQASCATVLLVAAGLLVRSFWLVQHVEPGFDPSHVLTASLRTAAGPTQQAAYFDRLLASVSQAAGVDRAAFANCMPASTTDMAALEFRDRAPDATMSNTTETCWISPDYFAAIGTGLRSGRFFTAFDDAHAPPVAIINRALAAKYWPGQSPIGKEIAVEDLGLGRVKPPTPEFRTVVGVVQDVKQETLDRPLLPVVYMPYHQDETKHVYALMNLFVRTTGAPQLASSGVREQIRAVNPDQPAERMRTMGDVVSATLSGRRVNLALIGSFASLAIVLCAIGIYGMISYSLAQRTREFGVRIAVGATRRMLVAMVLREGLRLIVAGALVGIVVSLIVGRAMSGLLFGIGVVDPWTLAASVCLLIGVGASACFVPAWRASSADPVQAIRSDY
jgi:predicted permease